MFDVGQKVVCVDDRFSPYVRNRYDALPKRGTLYTVRECELGRSQVNVTGGDKGWGSSTWKVLLVELVNPIDPSTTAGCPSELGFDAARFREPDTIEDKETAKNANKNRDLVPA